MAIVELRAVQGYLHTFVLASDEHECYAYVVLVLVVTPLQKKKSEDYTLADTKQ